MVSVARIKAGHYQVSDGRTIIKSGAAWYVLDEQGEVDLGPLPTLAASKEYVTTDSVSLRDHNLNSSYGRKQSKKEFNAHLASEAKKGNYLPVISWFLVMAFFALIMEFIKKS